MNIIMILIRILIVFLLLSSVNVYARMYQWTEPGTGTTQLSGKPPAWYRSIAGGARVFVFDKGRLIDDTAVQVSDEVRQHMRQQAFVLVEEDRQKAREKIAKSQELKQKYKKDKSDKPEQPSRKDLDEDSSRTDLVTDGQLTDENVDDDQEMDSNTTEKTLDELREMIADWEKAQTESARQALE